MNRGITLASEGEPAPITRASEIRAVRGQLAKAGDEFGCALVPRSFKVEPTGKPGVGNRHVRFDERGRERGNASATILDSTQV